MTTEPNPQCSASATNRRTFLRGAAATGAALSGLAVAGGAAATQPLTVRFKNFNRGKSTMEAEVPDVDLSTVDGSLISVDLKHVRVNNVRVLSHNHHVLWIDMKHSDVEDVDVISGDVTVTLDGVDLVGSDELEI